MIAGKAKKALAAAKRTEAAKPEATEVAPTAASTKAEAISSMTLPVAKPVEAAEAPPASEEIKANGEQEVNHVADESNATTSESSISPISPDDPTLSLPPGHKIGVENGGGGGSASTSTTASKSSSMTKLKYSYKDDQWSPINTEGKKQYDRDFLIQLQKDALSMVKPPNLPSMDIIKDKPMQDKKQIGGSQDFMPGFVKSTLSRGPGGGGNMSTKRGSRDGSGKRPPPNQPNRIVIPGLSINEKVELHQTENAWKPDKLKSDGTTEESDPLVELERKVRAILNKLTPQNFNTLVERFKELPITNERQLNSCIELIFEKVRSHFLSLLYCRPMCYCFAPDF